METTVDMQLGGYIRATQRYIALTGKAPEEALSKRGSELVLNKDYGLVKQFRGVRNPKDRLGHRTRIVEKAKSLNWKLGPISQRAGELAETLMGGQKSVMGSVRIDGERIIIRTVRIGKRGKRIIGGRRGTGGRAASLAEYGSEGFGKLSGEKILNKRALTVAFAAMLRMRGSGSLAAAWLYKQWRKGMAGSWRLENVNPKAEVKLRGIATMKGGESPELIITNKMPGVDKFPAAVAQALYGATLDVRNYLSRRYNDIAKEVGFE